ncbi:MAG: hypothetical protein RR140_03285 [Clostridia bacterium]
MFIVGLAISLQAVLVCPILLTKKLNKFAVKDKIILSKVGLQGFHLA